MWSLVPLNPADPCTGKERPAVVNLLNITRPFFIIADPALNNPLRRR
jgi:hypothetical protein